MTGTPPLHPSNQPRSIPLHMTVFLFQILRSLTAIAAHCTILYMDSHFSTIVESITDSFRQLAATLWPGLYWLLPLAQGFTFALNFLLLQQKGVPCNPRCQFSTFSHCTFHLSYLMLSPQPFLRAVKLEPVKDEPEEQAHHHQSSADVQPATVVTTQASPPPPKTPPVPAPSLPKHSTTACTARSSTGATSKPPPPSPSPTTSSEDPVLLMTNVPILKKARPGQPPLRLLSHLDPPIPRPHCNGHIMPFHFSHNILQYLDSNGDRPSPTPAAPPCPAPPPAFPSHSIRPPPQPAPPALFPPLPPLPELPLTDQQASQLTTAILRIARRAAAAAATNMLGDNEP